MKDQQHADLKQTDKLHLHTEVNERPARVRHWYIYYSCTRIAFNVNHLFSERLSTTLFSFIFIKKIET